MDITFLIGNGFDVSLGIKSSYSKFYDWYCGKKSSVQHIQKFRDNINDDVKRDVPDEEKTWADFELGMGKYTENFKKESVAQFLDCLEDAQQNIRDYLVEQEEKFNIDDFSEKSILDFSSSIWHFFDEISDNDKIQMKKFLNNHYAENRNISFLTFNYTNVLESILKRIPDKPLHTWKQGSNTYGYNINRNIIHVHGTTNVFPILGVNDETQIANKDLLVTPQFKELLVKSEIVNSLGQLWHSSAEEQISKSRIICIFGMSIGDTDAKWWRKIVQWLLSDSSRRVILYWHEKDPPNGISVRKQIQCVDRVKEKLISYTKIKDADKVSLKNQIYVVINTSKFLKLEKEKVKVVGKNDDLEPTA